MPSNKTTVVLPPTHSKSLFMATENKGTSKSDALASAARVGVAHSPVRTAARSAVENVLAALSMAESSSSRMDKSIPDPAKHQKEVGKCCAC